MSGYGGALSERQFPPPTPHPLPPLASDRRWDRWQQRADPSTPAEPRCRRHLSFFLLSASSLPPTRAPSVSFLRRGRGRSTVVALCCAVNVRGSRARRRDDIRSPRRFDSSAVLLHFFANARPPLPTPCVHRHTPLCCVSSRVTTTASPHGIHGTTDHESRSTCLVASPLSLSPLLLRLRSCARIEPSAAVN